MVLREANTSRWQVIECPIDMAGSQYCLSGPHDGLSQADLRFSECLVLKPHLSLRWSIVKELRMIA